MQAINEIIIERREKIDLNSLDSHQYQTGISIFSAVFGMQTPYFDSFPKPTVLFSSYLTGTIKGLIEWLKLNKLTERPELFVQGDSV